MTVTESPLGRFPLERLNPSIQVTVGRSNQAFHIADLIAELPSNVHEFLRELFIQTGDSFGDQANVGTQRLTDDIEVAFELLEFAIRFVESPIRFVESPIRFLVHGADLASKATDLASQTADLASQTADLASQTADLGPQPFVPDFDMSFEIFRSLIAFLVQDAELAS